MRRASKQTHDAAFETAQATGENTWDILVQEFAEEIKALTWPKVDARTVWEIMDRYGIGFKQY